MRILLSLALATLCLAPLHAQTPPKSPAEMKSFLDKRVPVWLRAYNVTSVSVAYIENNKIAWTAYYGVQVPDGPPASDKTLYNVASLTKPITAEVIDRLATAGKLSLDEPMFPFWVDPDIKDNPWSKLLTPRIALSHQTGFTNWRYQTRNVLTFQWEPGTKTGYSGEGFDYVARFAEKKTGRPFEELAQEYVFDPIGMKDTSYTMRPWWEGRQAKPVEEPGRKNWVAADLLRTTVTDYSKFMISVMNNERVSPVIAKDRLTVRMEQMTPDMQTTFCDDTPDPAHCTLSVGFGLSWQVVRINDEVYLEHTGHDSDVRTYAFCIPARKFGVVIFTNGPDVDSKIAVRILDVLYPNKLLIETLR